VALKGPFFLAMWVLKDIADYDCVGFSEVQVRLRVQTSERRLAGVVYLHVTASDDDVSMFLLGSKIMIAPMKTVTIPRLKLCALVLLDRWMVCILKMFDGKLAIEGLYAWFDFQIALAWLMNSHVFCKVLISNREHQVHQFIPLCRWLYVCSAKNSANCVQCFVVKLTSSS